ncbi:MAG: hypothetical protein ACREX4_16730 [Gammaproteobacteria bacterium]
MGRQKRSNGSVPNLRFEANAWLVSDKLRNNMDATDYKEVVLGLNYSVSRPTA